MKNVVITILSILLVGLSAFIIYDKAIKKEDKKENNVVQNNEVDNTYENKDDILGGLYKMVSIDPTNNAGYGSTNAVLLSYSGLISDMSAELKQELIYAESHLIEVTSKEYSYCEKVPGETCKAITKEEYYNVAKKYNIQDTFEDLFSSFEKYNDMVLFVWVGGGGFCDSFEHDLTSYSEGDNFIIVDNSKCHDSGEVRNKNTKYTFNKLSDGTYALYSVYNN